MPDAETFAEIDGLYVELLPARTVLSSSDVSFPFDLEGLEGAEINVNIEHTETSSAQTVEDTATIPAVIPEVGGTVGAGSAPPT